MKKLGILVTSDKYADELLKIARAALDENCAVQCFLTHDGVKTARDAAFMEMAAGGLVKAAICDHSWRDRDMGERIPGFSYASQMENAAMMQDLDRVISL